MTVNVIYVHRVKWPIKYGLMRWGWYATAESDAVPHTPVTSSRENAITLLAERVIEDPVHRLANVVYIFGEQ